MFSALFYPFPIYGEDRNEVCGLSPENECTAGLGRFCVYLLPRCNRCVISFAFSPHWGRCLNYANLLLICCSRTHTFGLHRSLSSVYVCLFIHTWNSRILEADGVPHILYNLGRIPHSGCRWVTFWRLPFR